MAKQIILSFFIFVFVLTGIAFAETKIERIAMGTGVKKHKVIGESENFMSDVNRLYCFTEIIADKVPTKIVHIWLYNDNIIAEVPLKINGKKWRTYSSKKIIGSWVGKWKVEVYSEDGKLIGSKEFTVED